MRFLDGLPPADVESTSRLLDDYDGVPSRGQDSEPLKPEDVGSDGEMLNEDEPSEGTGEV